MAVNALYVQPVDAEGAKVKNELRNDALKEIFKQLTINKYNSIWHTEQEHTFQVNGMAIAMPLTKYINGTKVTSGTCTLEALQVCPLPLLEFILLKVGLYKIEQNENDMEETLYNTKGKPIAYIDFSDEETIYLWDGRPVAYLNKDNIYGFNGKHLGWYENGVVYDHAGNIVGFNEKAATVFVSFEPFKAFKKFKPFKSFEAFEPFKPFYHSSASKYDLIDFLLQGKK